MLASALNRADVVLVDTRDTDDITARGGAAAGHINIPWSSFELYESRIRYLHSIFSSKDTPIVLYADPEAAQSAVLFKDALEQRCGYTNVQSCESADDLVAAKPSINLTSQPNLISNFVDATEIRVLYDQGAVLIDSRDPDEIEREKDSPQGHVNIPWSTFGHYSSKLNAFGDKLLGSNDKGKDSPVLVFWYYCVHIIFVLNSPHRFVVIACEGAEQCFLKKPLRNNAASRTFSIARTQGGCTRHSRRCL